MVGACVEFGVDIILLHMVVVVLVGVAGKQSCESISGSKRLIGGKLVVEAYAHKTVL